MEVSADTDIVKYMTALADAFNEGKPFGHETRWALREAAAEIRQLRACIKHLCSELEARKMLSFGAAEAIFSSEQ